MVTTQPDLSIEEMRDIAIGAQELEVRRLAVQTLRAIAAMPRHQVYASRRGVVAGVTDHRLGRDVVFRREGEAVRL